MILASKISIKTIKRNLFLGRKVSKVQLAFLPSYSSCSKLEFLLVFISYINQVTYAFLLVIGFSLFQRNSLSAMTPNAFNWPSTKNIPKKYSDQDEKDPQKRKREDPGAPNDCKKKKYSAIAETNATQGQLTTDMDTAQEGDNSSINPRRKYRGSNHPLTPLFFRQMSLSSRLEKIRTDIENWKNKLLNCEENTLFFSKEDLEKYEKIFEIYPNDIEPIQGLKIVKFNDLLMNSDNPNNINNGNTDAEVSILSFNGGKVAIKKIKDFQAGLKECFSSLIAAEVNSSPETKILTPFDAAYIPGSGFAMLMEGAYTHDVYHYLPTPLAGKVIEACAHFFAEFHINSHHDLINYTENRDNAQQNLVKRYREKYIEHLLKATETLFDSTYQEETEMGLLSLSPGVLRQKQEDEKRLEGSRVSFPAAHNPETINSNTIIRQLFDDEQDNFIYLAKHTINTFQNNSWEIFRSLCHKEQKFYPLVRVHGDAHGGNFFYDARESSPNEMNIPEDSPLRISMIDFASMIRTLNGGNLEEDVARFLGSIWVHASQGSEVSECYEKVSSLQARFIEVYLNEIKKSSIIGKQEFEKFEKIFKENCNFYKLRFYKVVFNLPRDKMSNEAKLKVLRSWLNENFELVSFLQKTALPSSPVKKVRSLFLKQIQGDIVYRLPDRTDGFIESMPEGAGKSYLTLLGEILESTNTVTFPSSATIAGMGGVGKTSLALQYAHEALKSRAYNLIYWVSASSLVKVYKRLLTEIGIPLNDLNDSSIIELVKKHLPKQGRCLLIYDDVPNPSFLEGKVPAGIHSLYTSRCNEGWKNFLLEVNVFSPQDSIKYLLNITGLETNDETESKAGKLAEELGYFPLALAIAGNSIKLKKGQSASGDCFIKYLKNLSSSEKNQNLFRKERMKLAYENLVGKTLKIATKQISPLAKTILVYSSYLDGEAITEDIFSHCTKDKEELEKTLTQLASLSLIKRIPNNFTFSLHHLVQWAIRNEEESTTQDRGIFLELVSTFKERFRENTRFFQPVEIVQKDFSHILKVLEHSKCLEDSLHKINQIEDLLWAGRVLRIIEDTSLILNYKKIKIEYKNFESFFNHSIENPVIPNWLEKNPHPKVKFALGFMFSKECYVERDREKALFYYTEAANQGDMDAQFFLAQLHDYGNYLTDHEAVKWFTEAAKQGDSIALKYLKEYATQGNAGAQFNLGNLYANGYGVKQNESKALKWFARAAGNGHSGANIAFHLLQELRNSAGMDF